MPEKFDIVIKDGRIIDGTGNPYYRADIGILRGKVACIRRQIGKTTAVQTLHVEDLVISPGFIDAHSHDDLYLLVKPTCDEKILQGVTTTVVGNCGFSTAPMSDEHRADLVDALRIIGSDHLPEAHQVFESLDGYLRAVESAKPGINVLPLVGHSTVRIAAMGSTSRPPTDLEMEAIKAYVARAMEEGAFGLSTGLIYAPGIYADTEELIEITRIVAACGGIYSSHIRSESDLVTTAIAEAIKIGREAGIPVHVSHHKVAGKNNWGRSIETLEMMSVARSRGVEITCDHYPYHAASTYLAAVLPPRIFAEAPELVYQKLKDPKARLAVISEIENEEGGDWENIIRGAGFDGIVISSSSMHPDYVGQSLDDIAKIEGKSPYDVVFDLVVEEQRGTGIIVFSMAEDDIRRIIRCPFTMVGSDGIPGFGVSRVHPRFAGTFSKILGHYVRKEGILNLDDAIRKMTSLPSQSFRLKRKGLLKEGFDADIVIFDPETVADKATFEDPQQGPKGIHYVIVNGKFAVERGEVTGEAKGSVLRQEKF